LAIWLIVRAVSAGTRIRELSSRLSAVEQEVRRLKRDRPESAAGESVQPAMAEQDAAATAPPWVPSQQGPEFLYTPVAAPEPASEPVPPALEPAPSIPAGLPPPIPQPAFAARAEAPAKPAINWEQFMGVKGLAWVGGLALFLGIAFFVKYSFDNNLIPPQLRAAIGFAAGIGLLIGGVVLSRKNYGALSQTLCATGVVVLYAVTFACRALYHFEFFGPILTFLLMALITTTAFLLAVRLDALVVAILGMLGGFLTPVLLSTGQDNPLGLFGYIAILDIGLILVSLRPGWNFLAALAAIGTALMECGWAAKFFESEKYFAGDKILVALVVLLGFNATYLGANWLARRRAQSNWWLAGGQLGLAAAAFGFTIYFFSFPPLAQRPLLLFSFVFLVDAAVATLAWLDTKAAAAWPAAGLAVFGLLVIWTGESLTNALLNVALACYFVFALFHSALPVVLRRARGGEVGTVCQWNHVFPPLALLLVLVPIFKLSELTFLVWPFVLLVDLLAIVLAVVSATLLPVICVLLLTLAATGALIFKIPADLTGLPISLFLLGAFAVFFVAASTWLLRKFAPGSFQTGLKFTDNLKAPEAVAALLTASSGVLPFLLLIMATSRLPIVNPTPIFGLALLLSVLLLGLAKLLLLDWLPLVALAGTFAVECSWHFQRFDISNPNLSLHTPLVWYLIFFGIFALFPFLFLRAFAGKPYPWVAAALAGPAQFLLVFRLVKVAWPNSVMGLLPAAFAVPAMLSLLVILKKIPAQEKERLSQMAWFGGVALFFITLIFPIQFDRQWITIGWALEGAALLWLFHRVPHPGLRYVGLGLLLAAFCRLALNPAVLEYHGRSPTPIFNWYLYSYGITTAALFVGVRLLRPPHHLVMGSNARGILAGLGVVLAFLLLNIEIADYFSAPGSTLSFQFSGNFPRDMTYSIAWAVFALGLLIFGIAKRIAAARYPAMGLLGVTLLKLFFHDLAQLGQLYRIGAFIGVAVIAMLASFAYQRFYSATAKAVEAKGEDNA
jgi:uncharacterized membrane protein